MKADRLGSGALLYLSRVHLPTSPESRIFAEELLEYEVKVAEGANDRYGAFKEGARTTG
jgi:hypothetical protein